LPNIYSADSKIMLIGNKIDTRNDPEILAKVSPTTYEQVNSQGISIKFLKGLQFANEIQAVGYAETSALTGVNIFFGYFI
jgi:hypothetical protein